MTRENMKCFLLILLSIYAQNAFAQVEDIKEEIMKLRDPFKMPEIDVFKPIPKTDLERYSIDAYKLLGVLTGPDKLRAMVSAPDGKTYFVAEKMKIGIRGGFVKKITPHSIYVREKVVNVIGQEESVESEIRMDKQGSLRLNSRADMVSPTGVIPKNLEMNQVEVKQGG